MVNMQMMKKLRDQTAWSTAQGSRVMTVTSQGPRVVEAGVGFCYKLVLRLSLLFSFPASPV
jgi:hypothetical protein